MKNMYYLLFVLFSLLTGVTNSYASDNVANQYNKSIKTEYKVSVELPKTHIPFADERQVVAIQVDDLKETMEAQEAGSFDKVFTNFTNAAFYTEEGEQLSVPNMSVLIKQNANGTFIEMKVPAGTEIKKDVYYFGKMNGSYQMEDLRTQGYEIYITLSAGNDDPMPFVNVSPNKDEDQTIKIDTAPYVEELGEFYGDIFYDQQKYILVNENIEIGQDASISIDELKKSGISAIYTDENGLEMTVKANTVVEPGKYYFIFDYETEYADPRWYGIENAYINLTSNITECTIQDIVIESYSPYSDIRQEGMADNLKNQLGLDMFNKLFTPTRKISYCFVDAETEELYPLFLIYPETEFVIQVTEEKVQIDNKKVRIALYDWNTEKPVELSVTIYTNLTVKTAIKIIDGELPATSVESGSEAMEVEISTEDLKFAWDFVNKEYWKAVFTDGATYRLNTENKEFTGLEMVYSEEKQVLTMTVPAEAELEKGIYYLATAEGKDLRDLGYTISIELEIKIGTSINDNEADNTVVVPVAGGIRVTTAAGNVTVYNISGQVVAERAIEGTDEIRTEKGLYLVRINNEVVKVVVE